MNILWDDETLTRHVLLDCTDPLAIELAKRLEAAIEWENDACQMLEVDDISDLCGTKTRYDEMEEELEKVEEIVQKFYYKNVKDNISPCMPEDIEEYLVCILDEFMGMREVDIDTNKD